jgi:hypothetical protein
MPLSSKASEIKRYLTGVDVRLDAAELDLIIRQLEQARGESEACEKLLRRLARAKRALEIGHYDY